MTLVFKRSLQSDDVLLVFWVSAGELLQNLNLFETSFLPVDRSIHNAAKHSTKDLHRLIIADDLDSSKSSGLLIGGPDNS